MAVKGSSVALFTRLPQLGKFYRLMKESFPKYEFHVIKPDAKNPVETLNSSEIVVADFDLIAPYLYDINIKWLQGTWAGIDVVLKAYKNEKGPPPYPIVRFSGQHFGRLMSEYIVSSVVAFERDFRHSWEAQKSKKWIRDGKSLDYNTIGDMKVSILGIGNIGSYVAKVLKCLGAEIYGLVRNIPSSKLDCVDNYILLKDIDKVLEKSDLVINILPNTPETKGLLNMDRFSKCKNALFVNIGRGSVTQENYILEAIEKGFLRGAILDVFQEEPLPSSNPLWCHPKVIITPHSSGVTRTKDLFEQFALNVKKYEANEPLPNCINFERGY